MITRLKVENFTAFDSLELEFGEGIQAFIGANGTGKTSILKTLYSVISSAKNNGQNNFLLPDKLTNVFMPSGKNEDNLIKDQSKIAILNIYIDEFPIHITIDVNHINDGSKMSFDSSTFSTFIPTKDILGSAKGFQSLYRLRETSFEEVYDDILTRAYLPRLKNPNPNYKPLLERIEKWIGGKVEARDEEFYLVTEKKALELSLVAEGWRKFALLWLLLQNGSLEPGSVLFWDEPEANLNPSAVPLLAHILLALSREGVQVFLATHSYVLLQELDLQKEDHPVNYHSLYFDNGEVRCNTAQDYNDITPNLIEEENIRLYHAQLGYLVEDKG